MQADLIRHAAGLALVYTVGELRRFPSPTQRKIEASAGNQYDYCFDHHSRYRLFLFSDSGFVTERQGGGPGGRFWRNGFADSLRPARIGDGAFESHHNRSRGFHGDVAYDSHPGDAKRVSGGKRLRAAEGTCENSSSDAGEEGSGCGNAPGQPSAPATGPATSAEEIAVCNIAVCNNAEVAELADAQ